MFKNIRSMVRATMKCLLFGSAVLWIVIEALLVLIATFHLPNGIQSFIIQLSQRPGIEGVIGRLVDEGWPTIVLVFLMLTWQELKRWAKQWFKTAKGHEPADLLILGWFVFLGTLAVVDFLSDVTLVLPMGARETSVILTYFMVASWCSRIAHWVKRQCECRHAIDRRPPREALRKGTPHPGQAGTRRHNTHDRNGTKHAYHTA